MATLALVNQIAQYIGVPAGKCSKNVENNLELVTRTHNNETTTGIINIIHSLLSESKSNLGPNQSTEEAHILQWLEYGLVYVTNISNNQNVHNIMKELNSNLSTKTFLVSNRLTIADLFLYHLLFDVMNKLSYLDKERYINVSRWFDNIQQDPAIRQKKSMVDFSTNYLINFAPARH